VQEHANRHKQEEGHSTGKAVRSRGEVAAPEFAPVSYQLVDGSRRAEQVDYRQRREEAADTTQTYLSPCGMTTSYIKVLQSCSFLCRADRYAYHYHYHWVFLSVRSCPLSVVRDGGSSIVSSLTARNM